MSRGLGWRRRADDDGVVTAPFVDPASNFGVDLLRWGRVALSTTLATVGQWANNFDAGATQIRNSTQLARPLATTSGGIATNGTTQTLYDPTNTPFTGLAGAFTIGFRFRLLSIPAAGDGRILFFIRVGTNPAIRFVVTNTLAGYSPYAFSAALELVTTQIGNTVATVDTAQHYAILKYVGSSPLAPASYTFELDGADDPLIANIAGGALTTIVTAIGAQTSSAGLVASPSNVDFDELLAWDTVLGTTDTDDLRAYLQRVPTPPSPFAINGGSGGVLWFGQNARQSGDTTNVSDLTANNNDAEQSTLASMPYTVFEDTTTDDLPSLVFDGTADYLQFSALTFAGSTAFTWAGWVRTSTALNQIIVGQWDGGTDNGWEIALSGAGNILLFIASSGADDTHYGATAAGAVPLNTWTHVAATYNAGTIAIYIDGVSYAVTTPGGTPVAIRATALPVLYGRFNTAYLEGRIDDDIFVDRAITPAEARGLATYYTRTG